ncbi:hypothetical protein [Streptomyces sp. NPDC050738]|uniref:hypothetical protein n=1 Tax=Streptomyces sp. NPDC050738 TaxID=3154744 RepID=UPI00341FB060
MIIGHRDRAAEPGYLAVLRWAVTEARRCCGAPDVGDVQRIALRQCGVYLDEDDAAAALTVDSSLR